MFIALFSSKDLSLDLGPTLKQDYVISKFLFSFANTLFPNGVLFIDSREMNGGGTIQPSYKILRRRLERCQYYPEIFMKEVTYTDP